MACRLPECHLSTAKEPSNWWSEDPSWQTHSPSEDETSCTTHTFIAQLLIICEAIDFLSKRTNLNSSEFLVGKLCLSVWVELRHDVVARCFVA